MVAGGRDVVPASTPGRHLFECSKPNCYRRLTFTTLEAAQAEEVNHKCPWWGGETKVAWSVTKTLVQQMWDKLDLSMDLIRDTTQADEVKHDEKVRARAIAECIAVFMPPFFTTANEVAAEALRRHKARVEGDTEYETPGLGARRYEAAVRQDKPRATTPPRGMDITRIPEADRQGIKQALALEMFTPEELSRTYKLSIDMIELIRNS